MNKSARHVIAWMIAVLANLSAPAFAQKAPTSPKSSNVTERTKPAASYKAVLINGKLFLKFLENDTKPFGPFEKFKNNADRYVYYPNDRPREFGSAMQIYKARESGEWLYSDNYVAMIALNVDMDAIDKKTQEPSQPTKAQK